MSEVHDALAAVEAYKQNYRHTACPVTADKIEAAEDKAKEESLAILTEYIAAAKDCDQPVLAELLQDIYDHMEAKVNG